MFIVSRRTRRRSPVVVALALAVLAVAGLTAPVKGASLTVLMEAGPHKGYHFSASGAVTSSTAVSLSSPITVTADLRHRVGERIYFRLTSGPLSGWQVVEGRTNHVAGVAGRITYTPARTVSIAAGRYIGYRFETDWSLASTKYQASAVSSTASASERAVINGRVYARVASGSWSGYWLPIAGPYSLSAQGLRCETPSRAAAGTNETISRVAAATASGEVALTFDMGGRITPALDIVERLVIDRVCATIFPTGQMALTTTGSAVMSLLAAHPELFEIGNHTMRHCNLRDGGGGSACPSGTPTASFIQSELNEAQAVFGEQFGLDSKPYWRPPYGAHNLAARTAAGGAGYTKTFMWDIDTIDWRPVRNDPPGPTAAQIADKVVVNARSGSIVLMHLGGYNTLDALPSMVVRLREHGLQPTALSDLLR